MNVAETLITVPQANELEPILATFAAAGYRPRSLLLGRLECHLFDELRMLFAVGGHGKTQHAVQTRSEERRVGKECRSRWAQGHLKKKKIIEKKEVIDESGSTE